MFRILHELYTSQKSACLYTNFNDINKFHFGTIAAVNDEEVAIQMITPYGDDDGIIIMNIDNVYRIETNCKYVEKMKKLCSNKQLPSYEFFSENNSIKISSLLFAFNKELVVSIELLDSGYNSIVGLIKMIEDNKCKIQQVDEYGNLDGISYIRIKDITKLSFLTQDEKQIMDLVN